MRPLCVWPRRQSSDPLDTAGKGGKGGRKPALCLVRATVRNESLPPTARLWEPSDFRYTPHLPDEGVCVLELVVLLAGVGGGRTAVRGEGGR